MLLSTWFVIQPSESLLLGSMPYRIIKAFSPKTCTARVSRKLSGIPLDWGPNWEATMFRASIHWSRVTVSPSSWP